MIYAKRAAILKKRRGDTPLLIGDAAASTTTIINHATSFWGTVANTAFNAALGAALLAAAGFGAGYGHHLGPGEARLIDQARKLGLNLDAMPTTEIEARLSLPPDVLASTISVLELPETHAPDTRWMGYIDAQSEGPPLPSRVEALRSVTSFIASAPPADQSRRLDDLRNDAALTERARSIVEPLRLARPLDGSAVGHLVPKLLSLPPDQLRTLEEAGFPPVPRDPDRQAIYRALPTLNDRAAGFVYKFVSGQQAHQQAAIDLSNVLQWQTVSRALGGLRDGDAATSTAVANLPRTCTADIPASCVLTSR